MIKKIIACLTICFIITGIISPVFSDASALPQPNWSDPGISEIINISDLTGWMLNGGTYDVSTYTDAESFMNDYFAARTKTRLEGSDYVIKSSFGLEQQYYSSGDSAYAHPLDVNRVIASSYRDHSGYGRRLSNEVNDALLSSGSLYDTKIPLLNEVEFANFVGYNHDALRLYSEFFESDEEETHLPEEYSYLQKLNQLFVRSTTSPVNLFNYTGTYWFQNSSNVATPLHDPRQCTIVSLQTGVHETLYNNWVQTFTYYPTMSINITRNPNGTANVTYSGSEQVNLFWGYQRTTWYQIFSNTNTMQLGLDYDSIWSGYFQSNFNSFQDALNYIYDKYSNIKLYVDNELWVNDLSNNNTAVPEFPDAVGGEDLPSTTWPIFRPRAPYYTSVPGVLQAIEDAIADDGKLDIDDLKPYLTDENGDPVPDPIFDPEPVPIPVPDPVNPDVVPGLPVLPAIPPDMPGFNGVSVLAEIINFTNQSLPTSLIVTFWGIVFGIVILGLIKILHK